MAVVKATAIISLFLCVLSSNIIAQTTDGNNSGESTPVSLLKNVETNSVSSNSGEVTTQASASSSVSVSSNSGETQTSSSIDSTTSSSNSGEVTTQSTGSNVSEKSNSGETQTVGKVEPSIATIDTTTATSNSGEAKPTEAAIVSTEPSTQKASSYKTASRVTNNHSSESDED
ncbi:cell wall integrity and stress response component 2-like [Teleopsis dalmanni]|uniref:cell wall integrity and stress response component 2-like n=1 Tax=Teleopsis dalmanni TaxID=139649 RepID=UPI000D32C103|nr:cell wall integrity and stress response component 2-like [Teleopsis dalmanni]